MDAERLRSFLLTLPHVVETQQWGNNLVFWVGDKAIGGKMFALMNLDDPIEGRTPSVLAYASTAERLPELLERDGLYPAPYFARIHWIAVERWPSFSNAEWEEQVRFAHSLTRDKLPPKTLAILAMPRSAQRRMIHASRQEKARKELPGARRVRAGKPPARVKKAAARSNEPTAKTTPAPHRRDRGTKAGRPRVKRPPTA